MRQMEGSNDRQLLSNLLLTWRDLKKLRELQGYTSTPLRLQIHKEFSDDPAAEIRAWDEEIRKEIDELEEEYQEEYNKQLDEYSKKLAVWKKRRKAMVGLHETCFTNQCSERYKKNGVGTEFMMIFIFVIIIVFIIRFMV